MSPFQCRKWLWSWSHRRPGIPSCYTKVNYTRFCKGELAFLTYGKHSFSWECLTFSPKGKYIIFPTIFLFFSVIEEVCAMLPEMRHKCHNKQHLGKYLDRSLLLVPWFRSWALKLLILTEVILVVSCSEWGLGCTGGNGCFLLCFCSNMSSFSAQKMADVST